MGIQFLQKRDIKGCLVGRLKDEEGRNIEVRHSPQLGYYCNCGGNSISDANLEKMMDEFNRIFGHKLEWQDIILITIERGTIGTCPPVSQVQVQAQPMHIAQKADGSWVSSRWNPDVTNKVEQSIQLPTEFDMPCKVTDRYCSGNTVKILMPYSEATLLAVKVFQTKSVDAVNDFIEELLK